ncbi:MAG: trypsin-like peptidase domain-containing protein, partial [Alphaproteobacteria bacterium]|nr:trypsin-like peptidase domain-containing protein [Alphaproteobacteria bacterium]
REGRAKRGDRRIRTQADRQSWRDPRLGRNGRSPESDPQMDEARMNHEAVVGILRGGAVIGGGFLAAPGVVLTCAHVVRDALGRKTNEAPPAGATVQGDFPCHGSRTFTARVSRWRPFDLDIAALEIDREASADIRPAKLAPPEACKGMAFEAFGFPKNFESGRTERGVVWGTTGDGLLEIRPTDSPKCFVEQGFSGTPAIVNFSPVRDIKDERVVGMVSAIARDHNQLLAYLLPIPDLERGWPPLAKPYRGLAAFNAESARWFRGRDGFVTDILKRLDSEAVVAIIGASGCGKSSVVKAGVVPAKQKEGWRIASCRIGDRPLHNLARELAGLLYPGAAAGDRADRTRSLETLFRDDISSALDHVDELLRDAPVLVVLDQFEELVTLASDTERVAFDGILTHLNEHCRGKTGLRAVLTLRSDYVDAIDGLACARHLLNPSRIHLTRMTRPELADAVQGPARELGVTFAEGVDGDLIGQVDRSPGLLPLLQYALHQLWPTQKGAVIPATMLTACGGLEGVLGECADAVLAKMDDGDRERARILFTRHLVTVTEAGIAHDTKRAATRAELGELWNVAQTFAAEGTWLLLIDQDRANGDATVEILHEALIRNWATLATWLNEVRELRVWENDIRRQMATSGPDDIWSPSQVARAESMLVRPEIAPEVETFARTTLASTRAADLWSKLNGYHGYEEAITSLPSIPSNVRDAMIGRLMNRVDCAEAFLRSVKRTAYGLFGIDPKRHKRVAAWIAMPPLDGEPHPLLRARCLLGIVLDLSLDGASLLSALRATTDPDQCQALGQALAEQPDRRDDALREALRAATNLGQCQALGQALAALAPSLEQPDRRADALLKCVRRATAGPDQCRALGQALAALAPSLKQPDRRADALLEALRATADPGQCLALGQALAGLALRFSESHGLTSGVLVNLFGALRQPEIRDVEIRRGNRLRPPSDPLAQVLMKLFGRNTLWEAMEVLQAAVPEADLSRPWPEPFLPARPPSGGEV